MSDRLVQAGLDSMRNCEGYFVLIGVSSLMSYLVFHFVWTELFPQSYDSLSLRLVVAAPFLPLLFNRQWQR